MSKSSKDFDQNGFEASFLEPNFIKIKNNYTATYSIKFKHLFITTKYSDERAITLKNEIIDYLEDVSIMTIYFCIIQEINFKNDNNLKINLVECNFTFVKDKVCNIIKIRNCKIHDFDTQFKNTKFNKLILKKCKISEEFLTSCQKFDNVVFKNCKITYGYNFKSNFTENLNVYKENNKMIYHYYDDFEKHDMNFEF